MEISPTITGQSGAAGTAIQASNANISSDFQTFLRMLTAQIQNQDPLNPMESSDFAVQLATFSGVEQQVQTNELLAGLTGQIGGQASGDFGSWLGKQVQFGETAVFDGAPVELALLPDPRADQSVLVIRNAAGEEVARHPVPLGSRSISWNGLGPEGDPLPVGEYGFALENYAAGNLLSKTSAHQFGAVTEARIEGGEVMLVLQGRGLIRASDVTGIRQPDSAS